MRCPFVNSRPETATLCVKRTLGQILNLLFYVVLRRLRSFPRPRNAASQSRSPISRCAKWTNSNLLKHAPAPKPTGTLPGPGCIKFLREGLRPRVTSHSHRLPPAPQIPAPPTLSPLNPALLRSKTGGPDADQPRSTLQRP